MKTLICNNPGNIEYIERDIPHLKDDEVLLKIKAVGICGTDIHAFAGRQPFLPIRACWVMKFAAWQKCWVNRAARRRSANAIALFPVFLAALAQPAGKEKPTAVRTSRCMAFTGRRL